MELIQLLIYLHAGLGMIALVAGIIAIGAPKGHSLHKRAGNAFFYSMLISGILAMLITQVPEHENMFLFVIGVFSTYLTISGKRSIQYKTSNHRFTFDKILSYCMILTGLAMIGYLPITQGKISIILSFFGLIGAYLALRDLLYFAKPELLQKQWIQLHIGKMVGAYIAALTAFLIVNEVFPGIIGWFLPSIIGTVYIWITTGKIEKKTKKRAFTKANNS